MSHVRSFRFAFNWVNRWPLSGNRYEVGYGRYVGAIGYSIGRHDRMIQAHIVEQPLYRGALRIGAAQPDVPIAVGMCPRVVHDDLAKRPPPCLRLTASFPDKAGDKQVFEVGYRHTYRLAIVGVQSSKADRWRIVNGAASLK